ncbi:hypothetical protein ACJJTC_016520 [Scirpophaga incertulas]
MSHWSGAHRSFPVEQYLKNGESLVRARRTFCTHFNIRRLSDGPSTQLIWSWVQRFRQEGTTLNRAPPGPSTSVATPERVSEVQNEIIRNPRKSIRKIAASTGIKKSTVQVILKKKLRLHPYKMQIVQGLNERDYPLREIFARTMLERFRTPTACPRTPTQLRLKWENLKKSARKRCANLRSSLNKTGGGKDYFPPDEVLDTVTALLGNTCQGFTVEFGGDANNTDLNLDMGEASVNIEEVVTMDKDANGESDGVCGGDVGQVLKEKQIIETPPPKHKNFFLTKASGSGGIVKRKHKMEEEKCKARILRENALTEYLIAKKKKIDLENEEKEITIVKLQLELENARLENLKLKADLGIN